MVYVFSLAAFKGVDSWTVVQQIQQRVKGAQKRKKKNTEVDRAHEYLHRYTSLSNSWCIKS